jgi:serine/threonine-protein kinase HipA
MHLKNWSLIYPDRRTPVLAPAYDLLSTITYMPDDKAALNYSRTKVMADLGKEELAHLASKARLPEKMIIDTAFETVDRFRTVWHAESKQLPLDPKTKEIVDQHAKSVRLFQEK